MSKHKHYELIVAWANGEVIQRLAHGDIWVIDTHPTWHINNIYRKKPKNKELLVKIDFKHVLQEPVCASIWVVLKQDNNDPVANVKFTFDGETGDFLSVDKI